MMPPRACVAAEQGLKEKYMMPATAATLAQGDLEVEAGRRAALGGDVDEQSGPLGRQSKSFRCKNRDSGGLVVRG